MKRATIFSILRRRWLLILGVGLGVGLLWLATSQNPRIWPVRNTLEYHALQRWWAVVGLPQQGGAGVLRGTVTDRAGQPIAGAEVLLARWDGTTYHARSAASGSYRIEGIAAGRYRPVVGAVGFADQTLGGVRVWAGRETVATVRLATEPPRALPPVEGLALAEPVTVQCEAPLASRARQQRVSFQSGGRPNQPTFLYTPVGEEGAPYPTLLAVYPGPVETWGCTSVPLAAAGYAVLAIGPAYNLELERDVDELAQLLALARAGRFPLADGSRIATLGGSYSAILTQRLLQRDAAIAASVLLGPPTDLFDARRRWEEGTFVPPFAGLEQALIALGYPDRAPLRYWRYSSAYHVSAALPPTILFHSYEDEIVPYPQSEQLAAVLDEAGVERELHLFHGGTHYLLAEGDRALEIYDLTLEFLERHLR